MPSLLRSPASQWAVPVVAITAVGAAVGFGSVLAAHRPGPAERSAADLLASVADSDSPSPGRSCRLPSRSARPARGRHRRCRADRTAHRLAHGAHLVLVTDQARFALWETSDETNIIRDGDDVWVWSSSTNTAEHAVVPSRDGRDDPGSVPRRSRPRWPPKHCWPPSTHHRGHRGRHRGGGRAGGLRARAGAPRHGSLIDDVRVAVDSETSMPLRVQVNSDGDEPAFEVGFTSVTLGEPSDDVFRFNPRRAPRSRATCPTCAGTMTRRPATWVRGTRRRGRR